MALSKPSKCLDAFLIEADEKHSNDSTSVLRANFENEDDVLQWFDQYKNETATDWIVGQSYKNLVKLEHHSYWKCQLNNKNKLSNSKRNHKCPAEVHVKIKKISKGTVQNDKYYLKRKIPLKAVITISKHSHPTKKNSEALSYLRCSAETKEIFKQYFLDGMGPAESKRLHEDKVLMQDDGPYLIANASVNPSERTVAYLQKLWRDNEYGEDWAVNPLAKVREKIGKYAEKGTKIYMHEDDKNWAVLVVTPIMQRVQESSAAGEVIFVDSTSSVESSESTLTVMLAANGAGAVPLAMFIRGGQSIECYSNAFSLLKKNHPNCFGGKEQPEVFMTDNSAAEKGALSAVWESCKQFLCHFHVAQNEWRWLLDSKHGVDKADRQQYMALFQQIMYAICTEDFEEAKQKFKEECEHEKYVSHVESFLDKQEEWVKMFRADIIYRDNDTNNYSEATIRILKDIVLNRIKAFNVAALVDFLVTVWELYWEAKLLHFAYGHKAGPYKKYKNLSARMPEGAAALVEKISENFYLVPNSKLQKHSYEVDGTIGWCSCPAGRGGAFCKHQALVHKVHGGLFPNKPAIDAATRLQLGKLSLGDRCPEFEFFVGLKEMVDEEFFKEQSSSQSQQTGLETPHVLPETFDGDCQASAEPISGNLSRLKLELVEQLDRIHCLGHDSESDVYEKALSRLVQRLTHVKTPGQATSLMLSLSVASNKVTRRCTRINVQPTAISRRRDGAPRGSKRLKAGRPSVREPLSKKARRAEKLPRRIACSINANKPHATKH